MKVSVGSQNEAKLTGVRQAMEDAGFISPVIFPMNAPSKVSQMPFSDEETLLGAKNRAEYCIHHSDAELGIGLEGGVMETSYGLFLCNWGALARKNQPTIYAGGARIKLPDEVAVRLRAGEVLGPLMDEYCKRENVRTKEGAIGVFTNGAIHRSDMFLHIVKMLIGQSRMNYSQHI